mgnify:FL=1
MEKTLGEKRVRTDFNVTGSDTVGMIKNDAAQMINMLEDLKHNTQNEDAKRLASIAQTKYEEAAMWAVKAATA